MAHYYDETVESQSRERELTFSFNGMNFRFRADNGVFSKNHLDEGSKALIEASYSYIKGLKATEPQRYTQVTRGTALDMGCGYGTLGIICKSLWPALDYTFVDVNERALALCHKNLVLNGISRARVLRSNGFAELTDSFDFIISNPPIRIGKSALYEIFRGFAGHLNEGGEVFLVIGKKQGAESAGRFLKTLFSVCEVIKKEKGFFIYHLSAPQKGAPTDVNV